MSHVEATEPETEDRRVDTSGSTEGRIDWKNFSDAIVAILNILMKFAGVIALAIIVFAPQQVPILKRFALKSSKINVLGQEIELVDVSLSGTAVQLTDDGKLVIGGVDANDVPDLLAKLRQTGEDLQTENTGLKKSVQQLKDLFDSTKKQLDEANAKLVSGSQGAVPAGDLTSQIAKATDYANQQLRSSAAASVEATKVIQQPDIAPAVGFGIVFGGDKTPEAAMDEVKKVADATGNPVILYHRQGSWRSVAYFGTADAAARALPALKKVRPDAYVVDISKWCPTPERLSPETETPKMAEQKDCGF
jgi:hypothetical protein